MAQAKSGFLVNDHPPEFLFELSGNPENVVYLHVLIKLSFDVDILSCHGYMIYRTDCKESKGLNEEEDKTQMFHQPHKITTLILRNFPLIINGNNKKGPAFNLLPETVFYGFPTRFKIA